jgi:hypothetical protein
MSAFSTKSSSAAILNVVLKISAVREIHKEVYQWARKATWLSA